MIEIFFHTILLFMPSLLVALSLYRKNPDAWVISRTTVIDLVDKVYYPAVNMFAVNTSLNGVWHVRNTTFSKSLFPYEFYFIKNIDYMNSNIIVEKDSEYNPDDNVIILSKKNLTADEAINYIRGNFNYKVRK